MVRAIIALLLLALAAPSFAEDTFFYAKKKAVAAVAGGSETVGYDTVGGSTTGGGENITCSGRFTASHTGNITAIDIYMASASAANSLKVGVYQNAAGVPATLIGSEVLKSDIGVFAARWESVTVSLPVTSGIEYELCFSISGATTLYYNAHASNNWYYDTHTYANPWPASYTTDGSLQYMKSVRGTLTW